MVVHTILNDINIHVSGFTVYGTPTYLKKYCRITCSRKCGINMEWCMNTYENYAVLIDYNIYVFECIISYISYVPVAQW